MILRPYQHGALDRLRAAIRSGKHHILLVAPTGSGKTTIAAEIIRSGKAKGKRTLFLAHRKELLDQCHDRLLEFGVASSIIRADDRRLDRGQPVQVASVQTLVGRLDGYPEDAFDLIIVDEAHHIRADSYAAILAHFKGASAVIGLTATPCRKDGRGLAEAFDLLVEAATLRELTEAGFLVPARMFTATKIDLRGVQRRQGDYVLGELGERMNSQVLVGNILDEWQRLARDRRTVVFATTVEHSQAITKRFLDAGVSAAHLDGSMCEQDRAGILERVRTGVIQVVLNCQVLSEGWDLPAISCAILARPTKSVALYLQMAGRVLRPAPGKENCIILDHANAYAEHGTVDQDRRWSLTGDKATDSKVVVASTKSCPECGFVLPVGARTCSECGFGFPPPVRAARKETADRLVEVQANSQREVFFDLVDQVRNSRRPDGSPYKLSAALAKYKDRFGSWPRWSWQEEAGLR